MEVPLRVIDDTAEYGPIERPPLECVNNTVPWTLMFWAQTASPRILLR